MEVRVSLGSASWRWMGAGTLVLLSLSTALGGVLAGLPQAMTQILQLFGLLTGG